MNDSNLGKGKLRERKRRGRGEELLWCFQVSGVPEDRVKNLIVRTDCCRMMVKAWEMEKLPEDVWAKEDGVIFLC